MLRVHNGGRQKTLNRYDVTGVEILSEPFVSSQSVLEVWSHISPVQVAFCHTNFACHNETVAGRGVTRCIPP